MKNNFREEFAREQAIIHHFEHSGSEAERESARADMRSLQAEIEAKGKTYVRIYSLYSASLAVGNTCIDISEGIKDSDVPRLVNDLRRCGIDQFTFSSGYSGAAEIAWLFEANGCKLEGLAEINSQHRDIYTGDYQKVHAFLFSVS